MNIAVSAVVHSLKDIAACICILFVMQFILQHKINTTRLKQYGAVFFVLSLVNSFVCICKMPSDPEDIRALLDFISNVLLIACTYLFTQKRRLPGTVLTVMIVLFTGDMFYSLLSPYIPEHIFAENIVNIIIYTAAATGLYVFSRKNGEGFLPAVFSEIPKSVFAALLLFELTCYYKEFGVAVSWYNALYLISSIGIVAALLFMLIKLLSLAYQKNQLLRQMIMERDYNEKMYNNDTELRRFRHDYKNHMIVVNAYLENGQIEIAKQYLDSLNEPVQTIVNKVSSGNFAVDAILDYKMQKAAEENIQILFRGNIPQNGIRSEDMCTVFANLLDNATEACAKLPGEKIIEIEAQSKNGHFILSMTNPVSTDSVPTDKKLLTTKKDRKNHGIGLKNVERAIRKYNGHLSTLNKSGQFTTDVRIALNEQMLRSNA